jgi:uncharacterized protein (TIGR02246 family)
MKGKTAKSLFTAAIYILMTAFMLPLQSSAQALIKGDAPDDTKQKIQELNKKMEEAFRSGDMVKVAEFYADDATVIIPGGRKIQGKKAIYDYLTTIKDATDFQIDVTDVNGSGKILYQLGSISFTANNNGLSEKHSSDQMKIWKRGTDWDYKISADIF